MFLSMLVEDAEREIEMLKDSYGVTDSDVERRIRELRIPVIPP